MNAVNGALTRFFDLVLSPLEHLGAAWALIVVSGIFGVFALFAFKHISSQRRIKAVKDRLKGHVIAIRIFQDDLRVVGGSVAKIVARNFQYLGLNFGPFLPLAIPFVFVAAQFVVRYAYAPVPLTKDPTAQLAGAGTLLEVQLEPESAKLLKSLRVILPDGVVALSPLVRVLGEARAYQEIAATKSGVHEIRLELDGRVETKSFCAGDASLRVMQPRRVNNRDWFRLTDPDHWPALWPAEPGFAADSPFASVAVAYPERDLGWLPGGESGILITFVVASMLFGLVALKPLGVQI
ncbi:MAG TPA: hypothetical protein VM509_07190 [Planctomycetota bacterium]|nr:hypothetical protein [Planctomycetota bacterium]